jgi:hypothetical protein
MEIKELKEVRTKLIKAFEFLADFDKPLEERKKEIETLKTACSIAKQIINSYDIELRACRISLDGQELEQKTV